ncbi:MAG: hypothetical protein H7Y05_12780 [Steroidobacteraceae bacterium]|nr:hypothetical protein [Deltaproteobacteria bacterium]
MNTQQQGIVDALKARMSVIAGLVTVTKNRPPEESYGLNQLPAVNVAAIGSEVIREHAAGTDERLTVVLSVFCAGGTAQDTALDYLASVLAQIGTDETVGGLVLGCRKEKRVTTSIKAEFLTAEAHQEITLDYRTPRWGI